MNLSNGTRISRKSARPKNNALVSFCSLIHARFKAYFSTFHHTSFTIPEIGKILLFGGVFFGIGLLFLSPIVYRLTHSYFSNGTEMLLAFVLTELIPVMLVGLIVHYGARIRGHFWSDLRSWLWQWIKAFAHDLWKHKGFILLMSILTVLAQVEILKWATQLLYGNMPIEHSKNTALILKLTKQNPVSALSTVIIAPIAEELIFRFSAVNLLRKLFLVLCPKSFRRFKYHHIYMICDVIAILMSAMIFAIFHDPSDISIIMLSGYMVPALLLQWTQRVTHSLTAPVLVHSLNNLWILTVMLLA